MKMYRNIEREPQEVSIHFPVVKIRARLTTAAAMLVSKKPAVTTFHNFDWPTVATGSRAKLSTTDFLIPGVLASRVAIHSKTPSMRVSRGDDDPIGESYSRGIPSLQLRYLCQ